MDLTIIEPLSLITSQILAEDTAKGGFLSEKSGGFLLLPTLQKNIPFYYPKLLHPVHSIEKIIIKFDTFIVTFISIVFFFQLESIKFYYYIVNAMYWM